MGFLDKAMKSAQDLAVKAEAKLSESGVAIPGTPGGEAAKLYQELGRLVHEEHRGGKVDDTRRVELLRRLDELAQQAAAPPSPGAGPTTPPPPPPPPPTGF